jgi:hypothetical protein
MTYSVPLILASSIVAALVFCSLANFFVPKHLRKRLFSREWWHFVIFMTVMFLFVYALSCLFEAGR